MNLKHYMCKLSALAPKVKLGPLEWDMPGLIRSLLDCKVNQRKSARYRDTYGNSVCVVLPHEGVNKTC
jgi:hypothetical protein